MMIAKLVVIYDSMEEYKKDAPGKCDGMNLTEVHITTFGDGTVKVVWEHV